MLRDLFIYLSVRPKCGRFQPYFGRFRAFGGMLAWIREFYLVSFICDDVFLFFLYFLLALHFCEKNLKINVLTLSIFLALAHHLLEHSAISHNLSVVWSYFFVAFSADLPITLISLVLSFYLLKNLEHLCNNLVENC